jgi:BESS motif.
LLDILKEECEHIDEDKIVLLSLVPAFKKMNDDQKYWAKMEMLGIRRKAKNMVFQPQIAQRFTTSLPQTYDYNLKYQTTPTV